MSTSGIWRPQSESALRAGVGAGLLEETHSLELKSELAASSKGVNKELARDIAQFTIDGGSLVFGVAEHSDGPPTLEAVPLAGLCERIEQIAGTMPDPPVRVSCRPISSEEDPSRGWVWVDVPASGLAPHMVDGVYYGRGDKTRRRLSDAEVHRLHQARDAATSAIQRHLDEYVARDPVPSGSRKQAHLFIVAVPVAPRHEMLLDAVSGDNRHHTFRQLVTEGAWRVGSVGGDFSPSIADAASFERRPDGAACSTLEQGSQRRLDLTRPSSNENFLEVEISDEGTVRVMTTRLSDEVRGEQVLFESILPVLTRQAVDIAGQVAEHASYGGQWMLGVEATGIAGLAAYLNGSMRWGNTAVSAEQNQYRMTTTASTFELQSVAGEVTARLVGRFVRSLGVEELKEVQAAIGTPAI